MNLTWSRYVLAALVLAALAPTAWRLGQARLTEYRWRTSNERAAEITKAGRPSDALTERQEAYDAAREFGQEDPRLLQASKVLAESFADREQYSDAYGLELQVLQLLIRRHGSNSAEVARQFTSMARLRLREKQPQAAQGLLLQAISSWQGAAHEDDPDMVDTLQAMIDTQLALNKPAEAVPYFDWTLGIQRRLLGSDHPDLAPLELAYADVLDKLDKKDLALRFREHANSLRAQPAPTASARGTVP